MSTYGRILSYGKPYHRYLPQYVIFAFLAIIFGLANLALLKPLFTVIFESKTDEQLREIAQSSSGNLTLSSLEALFYEKLIQVKETYGKGSTLIYVSIIIGSSALLANLFTYLANLMINYMRADAIKKLRSSVYKNTTHLHLGFFSAERKGDIMSSCLLYTSDAADD